MRCFLSSNLHFELLGVNKVSVTKVHVSLLVLARVDVAVFVLYVVRLAQVVDLGCQAYQLVVFVNVLSGVLPQQSEVVFSVPLDYVVLVLCQGWFDVRGMLRVWIQGVRD